MIYQTVDNIFNFERSFWLIRWWKDWLYIQFHLGVYKSLLPQRGPLRVIMGLTCIYNSWNKQCKQQFCNNNVNHVKCFVGLAEMQRNCFIHLHDINNEPCRCSDEHNLCVYLVRFGYDSLNRQINYNSCEYPDKQYRQQGAHHLCKQDSQ